MGGKYASNHRFVFHNYVKSVDISHTNLPNYSIDIVIMSLCLWGSNKEDYINEAYRVLDSGGKLLLIEANGERWVEEDTRAIKLYKLLKETGFIIEYTEETKFIMIKAYKI